MIHIMIEKSTLLIYEPRLHNSIPFLTNEQFPMDWEIMTMSQHTCAPRDACIILVLATIDYMTIYNYIWGLENDLGLGFLTPFLLFTSFDVVVSTAQYWGVVEIT
jgi:hypothetical protein